MELNAQHTFSFLYKSHIFPIYIMKKIVFIFLIFPCINLFAQQKDSVITTSKQVHVFKPEKIEATPERINNLKLPSGFEISIFAKDLGKPRIMAVTPDGSVYVTRRSGAVNLLQDRNNDGKAEINKKVLDLKGAHGLAIKDDFLYIITVTEVVKGKINKDHSIGTLTKIIEDLPDGGQHPNRTIAFGPDEKLYISVGSDCNACAETREKNATLLQIDASQKKPKIFAKGLRNTIGFAWHPETNVLYGMDHGIDWLGDDDQKEELNKIEEGKHYGWPYIYGNGEYNLTDQPEDSSWEEFSKKTTNPEMLFTAHSAPMNFIFYKGNMFPQEYKGSSFISFHGSWNRKPASGYKLMNLTWENGNPKEASDFVTGFLTDNGTKYFGRPVGLVEMPDGSLLLSDDSSGIIYRITYSKK